MSNNNYLKKIYPNDGEGSIAEAGSIAQASQGAEENLSQTSEAVAGAVNALKGLADGSVSPIEAALDIKGAFDAIQGLSGQLSESLIMPLMTHLAAFKGEAFLPVAKQLDPVMGIDVHFVTVPPGTPVPLPHPYFSLLFRAKDWVSCMVNMVKAEVMSAVQEVQPDANTLDTPEKEAAQNKTDKIINQVDGLASTALAMAGLSATVLIGGVLPRAITGTTSRVIPHIPMGAGFHPSFDIPIAKNNGTVFLGSLFVTADGDPMAGMMHLNYDCWDIGVVDLFKSQRNSTKKSPDPKNPKPELFVPTGSILPIPWGRPILINSVPTPVNPLSTGDRLFKSGLGKLKKSKAIAELRKKFKEKEKRDRGFCAKKEPMTTQQLVSLYENQRERGISTNKAIFEAGDIQLNQYTSEHHIYGQSEDYTCVATSLRMILADKGIYREENELANTLGTTTYGASIMRIPNALSDMGINTKAVAKVGINLNEISNSKNPTIVSVHIPGKGAHAVIVDKIENGQVYIRDPLPKGVGTSYSISDKQFSERFTGRAVFFD